MASSFNNLSCGTNRNNTGKKKCYEDFGPIKKLILTPTDGSLTDEDTALVLANWTANGNLDESDRFYPLPKFFGVPEFDDEETIYEENNGDRLKVREGVRSYTAMIKSSLVEHINLRTLNGQSWKCYEITSNGYIKGTTSDGTLFEPFTVQLFEVQKQSSNDGSSVEKTMIRVVLDNANEWDDNGAWVKPTAFNPLEDLNGLQDVVIAEETGSTTAILQVGVTQTGDGENVTGLVKEDFLVTNSDGDEDAVSALTDNNDGTYALTLTSGGADTYTVSLQATEDMTTEGYEVYTTASITVS